jgi:hypothetical protein
MSTTMSTSRSTSRTARLLAAPIAVALAVGLGVTVPAHASTTTKQDPRNDVFLGSLGGGIDLAAVELETMDRRKHIGVTFSLHAPALEVSLDRPGGLAVEFVRTRRSSRVVSVARVDGVLRGQVCSRARTGKSVSCSTLPVTQVDATTFRTVVRLAQVDKGAGVLRWTASSLDLSNGSPVRDSVTAKNRRPFRWRL